MVNRILSLQLIFTLAASQAWAISGGPYDGQLSLQALAGTYGISLAGTNADHLSTTGVMLLSVPQRGLAVAKTLVFDQGYMYFGTSTGIVKSSGGHGAATMITQLVHNTVLTTTDGSTSATATYADYVMKGVMKLDIAPDYFTGITTVSGSGSLWQSSIRLTEVTNSSTTVSGSNVTTTSTTTVVGDPGGDGSPLIYEQSINTDQTAATLTFSVDGFQQSTSTSILANFGEPSQTTNWGVGVDNGNAPSAGNTN